MQPRQGDVRRVFALPRWKAHVLKGGFDLVLQTDQDVTALDPRQDGARGFPFAETADTGQIDVEGL